MYAIVLVLLGLGFRGQVANHFGYALPWKLPERVHFHGRDFNMSPVACRPGDGQESTAPKGWVFGYFTSAKEIYADSPSPLASVPTSILVRRGRGCLISYELSGGP